MIAHLVNQQVVHELLALQILALFLENPSEDSIELACNFMTECGQILSDITPAGVNAIFERFRNILQDGEVNKRCQYVIEKLFKVRKEKFKDHQGVPKELDLVEEDDKITHEISLDDEDLGTKDNTMDQLNVFQFDPNYSQTEAEWEEIKKEILGETQFQ
jgi:pre-mRNA-splicing factor CWC22